MYFLDGAADRKRREDMVLSAAVQSWLITPMQAWPEFFGAGDSPPAEASPGGLTLEQATPESFAADMAALVQSSSRVTMREPAAPAPQDPGHQYVPDAEWT